MSRVKLLWTNLTHGVVSYPLGTEEDTGHIEDNL